MRQAVAVGLFLLTGMSASPALAARQQLVRPSPCERPIPTGRPLPRQGVIDAVGDVLMLGTELPTWRDRPIGLAGKDERVTILQECGMKLRIRNVRGLEGWINTVAISDERKAYETASRREPETDADCELLYLDPVVIDRCKIKLGAAKVHRDELANSSYLSADELRHLLPGRTISLSERFPKPGNKNPPYVLYYAPEGEYFMMQGRPQDSGLRFRSRYTLVNDSICFPSEGGFCGRMRKVGDDRVWATANGMEFTVTDRDGDPFDVVAAVSKWHPAPRLPTAPRGAEDVAGPHL